MRRLPLVVLLILVLLLVLLVLLVLLILVVLVLLLVLVILIVHDNLLFSARTGRAKPGAACAESDTGNRSLWERSRILAPVKCSMDAASAFIHSSGRVAICCALCYNKLYI